MDTNPRLVALGRVWPTFLSSRKLINLPKENNVTKIFAIENARMSQKNGLLMFSITLSNRRQSCQMSIQRPQKGACLSSPLDIYPSAEGNFPQGRWNHVLSVDSR